jgi:hypothetical protein
MGALEAKTTENMAHEDKMADNMMRGGGGGQGVNCANGLH